MNIFKKIFKKKTGKIINRSSENIVYDFRLRAPFASYRPIDYKEYLPFTTFGFEIDKYLKEQFKKDIDSGNGNTLDNLIFDMGNHAVNDLNKQKTDHIDKIQMFYHRRMSDKIAFEKQFMKLKKELERTDTEIDEAKLRYMKNKFTNYSNKGEARNV